MKKHFDITTKIISATTDIYPTNKISVTRYITAKTDPMLGIVFTKELKEFNYFYS